MPVTATVKPVGARAPLRVGFHNAREFAPLFYTDRIDAGPADQHAIDRYLRIAAELGCESTVQFPFHVSDDNRRHVQQLLPNDNPYVVLPTNTPGASANLPAHSRRRVRRPRSVWPRRHGRSSKPSRLTRLRVDRT